MKRIQPYITYALIRGMQIFSRTFYDVQVRWLRPPPSGIDPWAESRLVIILNHTSLYEWLYSAVVTRLFLRRIAREGVVPVADKTIQRPLVGKLFAIIAHQVVALTRKRDHTWQRTLELVKASKLMILLPEGRMKRSTGLDAKGRPMDIRGGIADVVQTIEDGGFLIAYSGGLHHIQHPGQTFPKLFQPLRMNFEYFDIAAYRRQCEERAAAEGRSFHDVVREDLQQRRDALCPTEEWVEAHRGEHEVRSHGRI